MTRPLTRVAAIHDLSGFGRTSLAVVIPVLSCMGIQVCSLPTAVLSSETGAFDDFEFVDLSSAMPSFLDHWDRLGARFDAVYSGFLGSPAQMDLVARCIANNLLPGGLAVVDPVLGDNGKLDPTMTPEMVDRMRWLVGRATCITPNLTEAALLLDEPYPGDHMTVSTVRGWLERLAAMGPDMAVITSVPLASSARYAVAAYQKDRDAFWRVDCEYIPAFYPGTGDTFASVLTGSLLQGDSLPVAIDRAVQFVTLGIRATFGHGLPPREGILLERVLQSLTVPMTVSTFRLLEDEGGPSRTTDLNGPQVTGGGVRKNQCLQIIRDQGPISLNDLATKMTELVNQGIDPDSGACKPISKANVSSLLSYLRKDGFKICKDGDYRLFLNTSDDL